MIKPWLGRVGLGLGVMAGWLGLTVAVQAARVTSGLVALYEFEEGNGSMATDTSGVSAPLDLTIINQGTTTTWLTHALRLDSSTILNSGVAASKIIEACISTNGITLEAWIVPANITQTGPALIVTNSFGTSNSNRNFSLGQDAARYNQRWRAGTLNDQNFSAGSATTSLTHVVFTRSSSNAWVLFINGSVNDSGTDTGDFSGWTTTYNLLVGNETSMDRAWLGELHLVAIYSRALNGGEVLQNYNEGADPFVPTLTETPIVSATPTSTATPTPTPTGTWTETSTATPTFTDSPTPSPTPSATESATYTQSPTLSPSPTISFTPTESPTATESPTITETPTISPTPTETMTSTISPTPSETETFTASPTPSRTPTHTPSPTASVTSTITRTYTITPTSSPTPTLTITRTRSATPTLAIAAANLDGLLVFPNPYREDISTRQHVTFDALPVRATIRIYHLDGKSVRTLSKDGPGPRALWDLKNDHGQKVASGVYVFIVQSGSQTRKGKVVLMR